MTKFSFKDNDITPGMILALYGDNPQDKISATQKFVKLLSGKSNPPVDEVIRTGIVPTFVDFLTDSSNPTLQFEAAWALTNIASGSSDQTSVVVDCGAVQVLVGLLSSAFSDDVREQAVWALGNIAGDTPRCRDAVLQAQALPHLLQILNNNDTRLSMTRIALWALSNFYRKKNPPTDFKAIAPGIPVLARLLHHTDAEVLIDACWALAFISDGTDDQIQAVVDAGVCRRLVELLMHSKTKVAKGALRAVGNIVTGNEAQTQAVLDCNPLPSLHALLRDGTAALRKEAAWTISNITAGNSAQIQAVIDNKNIIPCLVDILKYEEEDKFKTRAEAAWALSNATVHGTSEQIRYLVEQGCIPPFCKLLTSSPDPKIVQVVLDGIENILRSGQRGPGDNPYADLIEECGGRDKIEFLQSHENFDIKNKSSEIIQKYFNPVGSEEDGRCKLDTDQSVPTNGSGECKETFVH